MIIKIIKLLCNIFRRKAIRLKTNYQNKKALRNSSIHATTLGHRFHPFQYFPNQIEIPMKKKKQHKKQVINN